MVLMLERSKEAAKRGLPNLKTTPLALDAMLDKKNIDVFSEFGVYSHEELEARHEIILEEYIKKVQIEARVMGDIASTFVLPSAIKYQNVLAENIRGLKDAGVAAKRYANQLQILEKISDHIQLIADNVEDMIEARKKANNMEDTREKAISYCEDIKEKYFQVIRYNVDKLELMVDDSLWTLPKYREMLFIK